MAQFDSIEQILEVAIEREIEAYQLYIDLAKRAANMTLRKVFEEFAAEELDHKAELELEIIKTGKTVKPAQTQIYLGMDDYVEDQTPIIDLDLVDVLAIAIEKERRSVRFYVQLAATIKDSEFREVLLALAEQEAGHKARFEIEYQRLIAEGQ